MSRNARDIARRIDRAIDSHRGACWVNDMDGTNTYHPDDLPAQTTNSTPGMAFTAFATHEEPYLGVRSNFDELMRGGVQPIVNSGRSIEYWAQYFDERVAIAGSYGRERLVDGVFWQSEEALAWDATLAKFDGEFTRQLAGAGLEVTEDSLEAAVSDLVLRERKLGIRTYNGVCGRRFNRNSVVAEKLEQVRDGMDFAAFGGLEHKEGNGSFEIAAPLPIDKAHAVRAMAGQRFTIYSGDDKGDLPAMRDIFERNRAGENAGLVIAVMNAPDREGREGSPRNELMKYADFTVNGPREHIVFMGVIAAGLRLNLERYEIERTTGSQLGLAELEEPILPAAFYLD